MKESEKLNAYERHRLLSLEDQSIGDKLLTLLASDEHLIRGNPDHKERWQQVVQLFLDKGVVTREEIAACFSDVKNPPGRASEIVHWLNELFAEDNLGFTIERTIVYSLKPVRKPDSS